MGIEPQILRYLLLFVRNVGCYCLKESRSHLDVLVNTLKKGRTPSKWGLILFQVLDYPLGIFQKFHNLRVIDTVAHLVSILCLHEYVLVF